jgi:hypothetical protein
MMFTEEMNAKTEIAIDEEVNINFILNFFFFFFNE